MFLLGFTEECFKLNLGHYGIHLVDFFLKYNPVMRANFEAAADHPFYEKGNLNDQELIARE